MYNVALSEGLPYL